MSRRLFYVALGPRLAVGLPPRAGHHQAGAAQPSTSRSWPLPGSIPATSKFDRSRIGAMKEIILGVVVLGMLLSAGCGGATSPPATSTATTPPTTSTATTATTTSPGTVSPCQAIQRELDEAERKLEAFEKGNSLSFDETLEEFDRQTEEFRDIDRRGTALRYPGEMFAPEKR